MSDQVHLIRVEVSLEGLLRHAQRRRHAPDDDAGYATHSLLCEAFGGEAIGVCFARHHARTAEIWAYSAQTAEQLRTHAQQFADPAVYQVILWDTLASKPMPATWPEGQRLGFEVRICPVVRGVRQLADGPATNPRREVDAFLAATGRVDAATPVERAQVYTGWLRERLERDGAVALESAQLEGFNLQRLARRTQGEARQFQGLLRPDVAMSGRLCVLDGAAFNSRLLSGVGRHKAFGFGMLRLKPC